MCSLHPPGTLSTHPRSPGLPCVCGGPALALSLPLRPSWPASLGDSCFPGGLCLGMQCEAELLPQPRGLGSRSTTWPGVAQLWPQGRLRLPAIPPHSSLKPRAGPGLSAVRSQRTRPGWAQAVRFMLSAAPHPPLVSSDCTLAGTPDLLQLQPVTHRVGVCKPTTRASPQVPQQSPSQGRAWWGGSGWWTPSVHSMCCTPAAAPRESSRPHTTLGEAVGGGHHPFTACAVHQPLPPAKAAHTTLLGSKSHVSHLSNSAVRTRDVPGCHCSVFLS